jgi:hypothetical protein
MANNNLINQRVGAVCCTDKNVIEFFGYGILEGSFVPETDDIKIFGISLKDINLTNPRIRLDNGEIVWGCECWWDAEANVKKMMEGKEVKIISTNKYRIKSNEP